MFITRKHLSRRTFLRGTGVTLALAERCRSAGNIAKASELIGHAVENLPGHGGLLALEQNFDPCAEIMCWAVLFPEPNEDDSQIPD